MELNASRTKFDAKPSRYKAEAVRKFQEKSNSTSKIDANCPTKTIQSEGFYSLLDRYEIERISRQLDRYIESSRGRSVEAEKAKSNHREAKKVAKGSWLGSHAPLACGASRDEVVDRASMEYSRRRRSLEKRRAAAVELVGCRPRQGIRA
ncbi:hypothetical protein SASPL_145034 [Salvia splendens]|uniref:Uncharacterized protein n=1 Tax=Salvia splendens TaxID=180675 RepID=A0A8X8WGT7_SALSN|nr:hypothetical protein SASPL_145034 [Salvia splendens]